MFSRSPKYIKISILSSLDWTELKICALVSHQWHKLLNSDDFWKYKIGQDYGRIDNTNNISWRTWYYRIANSGYAHHYNDITETSSTIGTNNVYKIWMGIGRYYYLNIFGQLYLGHGQNSDRELLCFGLTRVNTEQPLYIKNIFLPTLTFVPILNHVKYMIPTNYGDFILNSNSELYVYAATGHEFIASSVKMIYGNSRHLLYLKHDLTLYYLSPTGTGLISKYFQSNVSLVRNVRTHKDIVECDVYTTQWSVVSTSYSYSNSSTWPEIILYYIDNNGNLLDNIKQKIIDSNVMTVMSSHMPIYIKYRPKLSSSVK